MGDVLPSGSAQTEPAAPICEAPATLERGPFKRKKRVICAQRDTTAGGPSNPA